MDIELTTSKLDSLARCVQRLRTKTPQNPEFLRTDVDTQDIIAVIHLDVFPKFAAEITRLLKQQNT